MGLRRTEPRMNSVVARMFPRAGVGFGRSNGGGGGPVTVLRDTFTAADGTNLTAHTMNVGPGWTVDTGTVTIQSNQMAPSGTQNIYADAGAGASDCTMSWDVIAETGNRDQGPIGRVSDASNHWVLDLNQALGSFTLYEKNTGSLTQRATTSLTVNAGTTYTVVGVFSGASIVCTVNGGSQISYSSATFNQTATAWGARTDAAVSLRLDNFLVTKP